MLLAASRDSRRCGGVGCEQVAPREIDRRIVRWLNDNEMGFDTWRAGMEADGFNELLPGLNYRKLYDAYGIEKWAIDCIRSIAFTDEPIPFYPLAAGYMLEFPKEDPPYVIAVLTPFTDADLAGRQVKEKCKTFFGQGPRARRKSATWNPREWAVCTARA